MFYKLLPMSDTSFSAYFEGSTSTSVKRMEDNIIALRQKNNSLDYTVSDKSASLLNSSKNLQTVEQVPWNIPALKDFKAAGEFKTLHG